MARVTIANKLIKKIRRAVLSQFTTNFKGELIGKNLWKNLEVFEYHVNTYPSDEIITVPIGFETDFASIPRFCWPLISPIDNHAKSAVIHDFCYFHGLYNRRISDKIFREGLRVLKIEPWKIWFMYNFVRICGWYKWNKMRKKEASV